MLCVGLGNAKGAMLLSTARQGSCFIPFLALAWVFQEMGICTVQAVADVVSLALALPLAFSMTKKIRTAQLAATTQAEDM